MKTLNGQCSGLLAGVVVVAGLWAQSPNEDYASHLRNAIGEAARGDISAADAEVRAATALDPRAATGWYELGSILAQSAEFQQAEIAFRRAIELQPDFAKAHYSLALTLIADPEDKQDWTGAIAECKEALKSQSNYPEALNLLGAALIYTGQADEAIPNLERALALSPAMPEAHFNLGLALQKKDRLEDAEKELRRAIAAKGVYPEATSALARLLMQQGKNAEAETELRTALRANPDLTDAHYSLARVLRALHREDEATVEFAEAKDLMDRRANAIQSSTLSNQGLGLAGKGDLAGAAVLLRKAIALKPDYGVPHYNLGLVLADSGDTSGAVHELTKAVSLLPANYRVWFNLGRALRKLNDRDGAFAALSWAAHLEPADPSVRSELASVRAELPARTTGSSSGEFQKPALGADSDTAASHLQFALRLNETGDYQGAQGELLRSLSLEPANLDARRTLASAYAKSGDREHAALEYYKVLLSAPDDVDVHIALGNLLLARDDKEAALKHFRMAVKYAPGSEQARAALAQAEKSGEKP